MLSWLLAAALLPTVHPPAGAQLYMYGEMHGLAENEALVLRYINTLYARGLRDVAIEEDAVYESAAQAYVIGRAATLPAELCLRATSLRMIREFNHGKHRRDQIHVHLVDLDSPAEAIAAHAAALRQRGVDVPDTAEAVMELAGRTPGAHLHAELRTLAYSMKALKQGFSVGTGIGKGSPYLEEREQAITENLQDIIHKAHGRPVLASYGADHVSRTQRADGGPNRDQPFQPVALRLAQSGIRVHSTVAFPLSGSWQWCGRTQEALWSAEDGELDGVRWDRVFHDEPWLFLEKKKHAVKLPSQDLTAIDVDAYIVIRKSTPVPDACKTQPTQARQ